MSPLAMPGPDFLVFYWKSFAVALGLTLLLRWQCRRRFASGQSFAFMRRDLGATELAVISGKPHRLVELALARLARDGRLAVGADGKLECVGNLSPGAGEVEGQVYNALKGGSRTLEELRKAVEPPADCKTDWQIFGELARRMGAASSTATSSPTTSSW
mgnify:CR=1 FL=1